MTNNALEVIKLSKSKHGHMGQSKFKATLVVFFNIQGNVIAWSVPSGQNVNTTILKFENMTKLHGVKRKQPGVWRNGWILHQGNVPPCNTLSVKQFAANKHIIVFAHPLFT